MSRIVDDHLCPFVCIFVPFSVVARESGIEKADPCQHSPDSRLIDSSSKVKFGNRKDLTLCLFHLANYKIVYISLLCLLCRSTINIRRCLRYKRNPSIILYKIEITECPYKLHFTFHGELCFCCHLGIRKIMKELTATLNRRIKILVHSSIRSISGSIAIHLRTCSGCCIIHFIRHIPDDELRVHASIKKSSSRYAKSVITTH